MFWFVFCRTNLTGNRLRPSPQDTYRYGKINITRTIRLASSARQIKGNQRYAVNRASFYPSDTPLKLADFQNWWRIHAWKHIWPAYKKRDIPCHICDANWFRRLFSRICQSWHLDGYSFFLIWWVKYYFDCFLLVSLSSFILEPHTFIFASKISIR